MLAGGMLLVLTMHSVDYCPILSRNTSKIPDWDLDSYGAGQFTGILTLILGNRARMAA